MTLATDDQVLEELRAIRADVHSLGERMERIESRLGVIEQRLSAIELHLRATQPMSPGGPR